jgi:hypothetical protein
MSQDLNYNYNCTGVPWDVTPATQGQPTNVACSARGRYVTVWRQYSTASGDSNILQICEIKVYAQRLLNQPSPRYGHAAVPFRGQMVVFGGTDTNGYRLNDLNFFDLTARQWIGAGRPSGQIPSGRAYAALAVLNSGQLGLYGGSSTVGMLSDFYTISFPACPAIQYNDASAGAVTTQAGTVQFYTCQSFGTNLNPGNQPVICSIDGAWQGNLPPCQGSVPYNWPATTFSSLVSVSGTTATAFWTAPTVAGYYPLQQYRLATVPQEWTLRFLASASAPVDASGWTAMQMAGGNAVSFQPGWLVLEAAANANCWTTTQACPVYYRNSWPAGVPSDAYIVEAFIQLDTTVQIVQNNVMVWNHIPFN